MVKERIMQFGKEKVLTPFTADENCRRLFPERCSKEQEGVKL